MEDEIKPSQPEKPEQEPILQSGEDQAVQDENNSPEYLEGQEQAENLNENIQNPNQFLNPQDDYAQLQSPQGGDPDGLGPNGDKGKRHRRGKNEINERNYQCPDCDKCYLSGPALTTHRKTKHGYGTNGEKKARGRPRKDFQNENNSNDPKIKFCNFFINDTRKPPSLDQTVNDKTISLEIIKTNLIKIFRQCQKEIFKEFDDIEKYSFYHLVIDNWEKEDPALPDECYSAASISANPEQGQNNTNVVNKIKNPPLDILFYNYLREFSKKTNVDYFWFMSKFIILFRECVNKLRKNLVKPEHQTEENKDYSQIYSAETIPEICNDFFVDFMEPYDNFGLNQEELIELIQHFCYWLYNKRYTQSHLTLLPS